MMVKQARAKAMEVHVQAVARRENRSNSDSRGSSIEPVGSVVGDAMMSLTAAVGWAGGKPRATVAGTIPRPCPHEQPDTSARITGCSGVLFHVSTSSE